LNIFIDGAVNSNSPAHFFLEGARRTQQASLRRVLTAMNRRGENQLIVVRNGKNMAINPKQIANDTNSILNAWNTIAPGATFAGMTFAQYKTKVQPSFDARTRLDTLDAQMTSATDDRDNADVGTTAINQLVVNAVKGDPNYGDDSDLYDAMGYVRRSARASGLTRNKSTPVPPAKA
jgi:hypothetical protein